ncbi:MAG: protein translocase subunit SecF [Pseudomonadota bacterium]
MVFLRLVPKTPNIRFIGGKRRMAYFAASLTALAISLGAFFAVGLNFGIDFRGGVMIEARSTTGPADISAMRPQLEGLGLGEVTLQTFGADTDVLIRVQRQEGGDDAQQGAVDAIRGALGDGWEWRRTEVVGPTVGAELIQAGIIAVALSIAGILLYVWLRFEWQFALAAVAALAHDVLLTIGLFAILQLEFNLSTIAAVLTIAGYSINDTVVIFDRVRENLRRYKTTALEDVLNRSINETLSRTLNTSVTTLLALLALYFLGGAVISDFSFAMMFGVIIGTYSTICLATPLLTVLGVRRTDETPADTAEAAKGST